MKLLVLLYPFSLTLSTSNVITIHKNHVLNFKFLSFFALFYQYINTKIINANKNYKNRLFVLFSHLNYAIDLHETLHTVDGGVDRKGDMKHEKVRHDLNT